MTPLVLGLDQGTSSTRCVALDEALHECGAASVPLASSFPRPGWVEQDPEAVVDTAGRVLGYQALRVADASILPTLPAVNPMLTCVLIGERIVERW